MTKGLCRVLLCAIASIPIASEPLDAGPSDWTTEAWTRVYALSPPAHVTIQNVNGAITIQGVDGDVMKVFAQKIGIGDSPGLAGNALRRIVMTEAHSPSSVRLQTSFEGNEGRGQFWRVDYVVSVPPAATVEAVTINGPIDVVNLSGRVRVRSTHGGVSVRDTAGHIDAYAEHDGLRARNVTGPLSVWVANGGIDAEIARVAAEGVSLRSTDGAIRLRLPPDVGVRLSASSRKGGIDLGRFRRAARSPAVRDGKLTTDLNGGGPYVTLTSLNGGIRLRDR